jgi:hypothetical protein
MKPALIDLNFAAPSRRPGVFAITLLVVGVSAAVWAGWTYQQSTDVVAGLELRLGVVSGHLGPVAAASNSRLVAEAQHVAHELQTPWAAMLDDLETATASTHGEVALLTVEPDRLRQRLKLTAEARSLPAALRYVQSLQQHPSLHDALLESHEIRTDVAERPVRVQIVADWRIST